MEDKIVINLSCCRYGIIEECAKSLGFTISRSDKDDTWTIFFMDKSSASSRVQKLRDYQMINHFPEIQSISKKKRLSKNMKNMKLLFPQEFEFYPVTFVFPEEENEIKDFLRSQPSSTKRYYMIKPCGNSCGRGYVVTNDPLRAATRIGKECIIQEYVDRPMLMDMKKFDLRMYLLITSVKPLTLYLFQEGLVRIARRKYEIPNTQNMKYNDIHLGCSGYFSVDGKVQIRRDGMYGTGCVRDFGFLRKWMGDESFQRMFREVEEILVKSVLSGYPKIKECYEKSMTGEKKGSSFTCFEILGVDVMFDCVLNKPTLLGIIHSPMYQPKGEFDSRVMKNLISDTFRLLAIDPKMRKTSLTREFLNKEKLKGNVRHRELSAVQQPPREYEFQRRRKAERNTNFKKIFPKQELVVKLSPILLCQKVSIEKRFVRLVEGGGREKSVQDLKNEIMEKEEELKKMRTLNYDYKYFNNTQSSTSANHRKFQEIDNQRRNIEEKDRRIRTFQYQLQKKDEQLLSTLNEATIEKQKSKEKDEQIQSLRNKIMETDRKLLQQKDSLSVQERRQNDLMKQLEQDNILLKRLLEETKNELKDQILINQQHLQVAKSNLKSELMMEKERIENERVTREVLLNNDFGEYCQKFIDNKIYYRDFGRLTEYQLETILKNRVHVRRFILRFPIQQEVVHVNVPASSFPVDQQVRYHPNIRYQPPQQQQQFHPQQQKQMTRSYGIQQPRSNYVRSTRQQNHMNDEVQQSSKMMTEVQRREYNNNVRFGKGGKGLFDNFTM